MFGKHKAPTKTEQVKGAVKETIGRVVGSERLTAEGRAERGAKGGGLREVGRKARKAFKH